MVHPGNYLRARHGHVVGPQEFKHTSDVFQACIEALDKTLEESIRLSLNRMTEQIE